MVGASLFGVAIRLAVDAITGELSKLTPEQVAANLQKQAASLRKMDGLLYVTVVLRPDPSWRKVGQLAPAR